MNEQSIFEAVLAIDEPTERSAYLDRACAGAAALRAQVEKLLKEHERSSGARDQATPAKLEDTIDETPAAHEAPTFLLPSDKPGVLGRLDRYEVLEVIGKGGMGMVLRAFDERLQRMVAIKVMAAHLAINATARKRFGREARTAAAVSHDHIVTIHAVEEARALPYLVMKYVPGVSLQQRLRDGPLPLEDIVRIGMETASGLAAAHAKGLIHRDIKPANILLETKTLAAGPNSGNSTATLVLGAQPSTGAFRVKITDFGLARAADDSSLTQTGVVAGTPDYMSPEQARGERVDARTDLFSLGTLLYFMCTRRTPFHADETLVILSRVCDETPTPIRQINPEIPDWLAALIKKLHAKDPAKRFQSAAEVAEVLGQHLALLRNPAPVVQVANVPEHTGGRQKRRPRRRRAIIASLVLLLGGLSLVGLALMEISGVTNFAATVADFFRPDRSGANKSVEQQVDEAPDVDLAARGQGFAEAAQWDKAAADFAKAIERGSEDIERVWYPLALLHLRAGRTTEYRALCDRLLKLTPEPKYTYRVLIICKLGPDAVADYAPLVRLAEALVAPNPNNAEYVGLLGHTLHRKGDWQAAAERLEAANRMDTGLGAPWRRLMLAMTYHRLGRSTEAAYHFGEVSAWMEKNAGQKLGDGAELKQPLPWTFRLDLELLRRETAQLLNIEPGWVQLFNGKDLTGWKHHPDQTGGWTVEEGHLVGRSKLVHHLFSERGEYEDFHLRAEVQVNKDGNSGIYFRARFALEPQYQNLPFPRGYEAQILNSYPRPTAHMTGSIYGLAKVGKSPVAPDTWFTLDIIARGDNLVVKVNDQVTAQVSDKTHRRGHLVLQAMSDVGSVDQTTVVRFRKIEIKELPREEPGWVQLFNGKDLTGWNPHPNWKVKDGILIGSGPTERNAFLVTERKDYEDFHLRVEVRILTEDCDSGVLFRGWSDSSSNSVQEANIAFHPKKRDEQTGTLSLQKYEGGKWAGGRRFPGPPGLGKLNEWVTLEVIARGPHVITKVNGTTAVDTYEAVGHRPSHISLQQNGAQTVVHFRKVEIKELPPDESSAVDLAEKALEKDPDNGLLLKNLGTAYYRSGRWQLAADTLARADKVGHGINQSFSPFVRAMACSKLGDHALAQKWYEVALVWMARVDSKDPELVSLRDEAAKLLKLPVGLSPVQEQAVKDYSGKYLTLVLEADPEATWAYHDRGLGYVQNKKWDNAVADFRREAEILEKRVAERPQDVLNRRRLAWAHQDLAKVLLYHLAQPVEAAKSRQRQVALFQQLVAEFPNDAVNREHVGHSLRWLAFDFQKKQQPLEAEKVFDQAIEQLNTLVGGFPGNPDYRGLLADTYDRLRRQLAASGKPEEAAKAFDQTIFVLGGFPAELATTPAVRVSLSELHHRRGNLLREAQRPGEAEAAYRQAIEVRAKLVAEHPTERSYGQELGRSQNWLGIVLTQSGRPQDAEQAHRDAYGIYEKLTKETATLAASVSHRHRRELAWTCLNLGEAVEKAGRFDESMELYRRAGELCEKLATENSDGTYANWERHSYGKQIQLLTGAGRPQEAMAVCRKLFERKPPLSGQALNVVAWSLVAGADPKSWAPEPAVELAQKAVELVPNSADCWNTLGVAHYRAGDWQAAISELKKSDALEGPNYFELNAFYLAMAHWYVGEEEQARKWYDAALVWMEKRNAKNDVILRSRDEAASLLGLSEKLSPEQEKAKADDVKSAALVLEANPESAWAHNHRGRAFGRAKEWDKALADFSRAIELKPTYWLNWADRAWIRKNLKQSDEAIADNTKAVELGTTIDWVWRQRGEVYAELGQWDKALADYSKAIELKPTIAINWTGRGNVHAEQGQWEKAATDFSKATELNADDPQPRYRLALLRLKAGDRDGYKKTCDAMLKRFGPKETSDANYWAHWTSVLGPDAVADWQPVVPLAEKILAADPKNCDKLKLLGAVFYRAGRFDEAVKHLADAEAAYPEAKNPRGTIIYCWLFQAMSLHRLGQAGEAKKCFEKAKQAIDEPPAKSKDDNAGTWSRRLTLELLRSEVEMQRSRD